MDSYKNCETDILLLKCRDHDDDAFDELVSRYTPMMRRVVSGFGSAYDFSELFSEACVALHTAAQRFDMEQSEVTFGLYARICVRNRILDLIRRREPGQSIECDVEQMPIDENPEGELVKKETFHKILNSARLILSDYEYRVLLLHIQGYKTASIAEMLSRTPKSVDNAKSRLFRRLREELSGISDN